MIWGGDDVIIIEKKCIISIMHLNHSETIPPPPPPCQSVETLPSPKLVPGARKVGAHLLSLHVYQVTIPTLEHFLIRHFSYSSPPYSIICFDSDLFHLSSVCLECFPSFTSAKLAWWKSHSRFRLFVTPRTIQTLEFSRPEYWSV